MAKVLHIDDDPIWRSIVVGNLKNFHHEVCSFPNLLEAKEVAKNNHFDLFICESSVVFSGDGQEWAEELHAQGETVLILSYDPSYAAKSRVPFMSRDEYEPVKILKRLKGEL